MYKKRMPYVSISLRHILHSQTCTNLMNLSNLNIVCNMDELVMNGTDVLKNLLQSKDGRVFGVTDFDA